MLGSRPHFRCEEAPLDILTTLSPKADYSAEKLQLILLGWVMARPFAGNGKISTTDGDVSEDDYTKQSIYSLLYSVYREVGEVPSETGEMYEFTFNTWGYAWPEAWGDSPTAATDPQRFGKNAYTGLLHFAPVQDYVREREGRVHVVEMGCGTGAGAHQICKNVLPSCTYEAVDMQRAAIQTCERKFVPELDGRLVATCGDCTTVPVKDGAADIVVVCETHVTEHEGVVGEEDKAFFRAVHRILKPGGFLVWGNAIPDSTWQPCFDFLDSIGIKVGEVCDVTKNAVAARDQDAARADIYVDKCLDRFFAFRIPLLGRRPRRETMLAMKNFYRHPGTNLYNNMVDGTDSYRVVVAQKQV